MSSRIRVLALPVVLPVVALLLMIAAMAVPDRAVMDQLVDAVNSGSLQENSYPVGDTGSRLDRFSECKRITIGLGGPGGLLETAVQTPSLGPCERAVPKIRGWAQGEGLTQTYSYFRYWNGSAVVFRPVIAAVGLDATRILAAIGVALAALAFWSQLARRVGRPSATLALVPVVVTTDFIDLPGALLHALGMIVALSAAALLVRYLRGDALVYGAAGFVAGSVFLFFGDMTNPDAAWALSASSAALVAVSAVSLRSAAWRTLAATVGWGAGFAWTWVSKWLIAIPVLGLDEVWSQVTRQAEFRLAGETDGGFSGSLFGSTRGALEIWSDQPLMIPTTIVVVVVALVLARRVSRPNPLVLQRLLIAAPGVIPIGWHLVMRNHTHFHGWFTYRSFPVAFGIILLAATARLTVSDPARSEAGERDEASQTPADQLVDQAR